MDQYAGLDVSLKAVSICVSDEAGTVQWRGEVELREQLRGEQLRVQFT